MVLLVSSPIHCLGVDNRLLIFHVLGKPKAVKKKRKRNMEESEEDPKHKKQCTEKLLSEVESTHGGD